MPFQESTILIAYTPIGNEPDPFEYQKIADHDWTAIERVPPHAGPDPFDLAKSLAKKYSGQSACVLVPGTKFDSVGNRKGRGGGWYDRFLSAVPRKWLRVGVCDVSQLTAKPLEKHPHDERMDVLLIRLGTDWHVLTPLLVSPSTTVSDLLFNKQSY